MRLGRSAPRFGCVLTGLVFGIIAVVWIAYLVPWILSRREQPGNIDDGSLEQFAESMKLVRRGNDYHGAFLVDSGAVVSTPLTRRAARRDLRVAARLATRRRRNGMIVHLVLVLIGIAVPSVSSVPRIWTLLPVGMLIGWLVLSRLSVVSINRMLAERRAELTTGNEEHTVMISAGQEHALDHVEETERSIEITDELPETLGSLWDPIPVTPTTYVSRPLLPRSVRTLDLSAPVSSSELATPLATEVPRSWLRPVPDDLPHAVGQ